LALGAAWQIISPTEVKSGLKNLWAFFLLIRHQQLFSDVKGHYQREKDPVNCHWSCPQRCQWHSQPAEAGFLK